MSGRKPTASDEAGTSSAKAGGYSQAAPLKPMPKLLVALSIIFAIWVAGLVTMYVTTVYPHRHDTSRNAPEVDR